MRTTEQSVSREGDFSARMENSQISRWPRQIGIWHPSRPAQRVQVSGEWLCTKSPC